LNKVNTKPGNPSRNRIPIGIKEQTLIDSIEKSGYPLQGVVANKLLTRAFHVTEEWGYADRDTRDARSLDVAAYHGLGSERAAAVNPCLFLLIECKRSTHPYVFFRTATHPDISWFPHIADLPHGGVVLCKKNTPPNHRIAQIVSASKALGLNNLPFVQPGTDISAAFSQAKPYSNRVELSGSEAFNALVLPLAKALHHACEVYRQMGPSSTIFPRLILSTAVLDAPTMLVESPERASEPILTPWVRIIRQEPNPGRMLTGSLPAAALTVGGLWLLRLSPRELDTTANVALSIALAASASVILFREQLHGLVARNRPDSPDGPLRQFLPVAAGAVIGVLVTLSSVGAGAIGVAVLLLMFPWIKTRHLVGTDLAHGVVLALVTGPGTHAYREAPLRVARATAAWNFAGNLRRHPDDGPVARPRMMRN
jgi:hypothetical protein